MNKLIFWVLLVILSNAVSAYPIIISESGTNHTLNSQLVYSIPEKYYKFVEKVEFVNGFGARCIVLDEYDQMKCWKGWNSVYWDKNHNCLYGNIILSIADIKVLIHELGHIYEYCELKRDTSTEEFADNFKI